MISIVNLDEHEHKHDLINEHTGHFKILCSNCGNVIAQCRCISGDKRIEYQICQNCRQGHRD